MIQARVFRSESGYRPMSAFVVVAVVLVGVASRVAQVALADGQTDHALGVDEGLRPTFELVDAHGRRVAGFVERLDLVASPRSMWLAHTPDHMAARIAEVAGRDADDVLERLLPDVGEGGWIDVKGLPLTPRQASAIIAWADRGATTSIEEHDTPLSGIEVVAVESSDGKPRFQMRWQPAVVLSKTEREAHSERAPTRWTRRLLEGLSAALYGVDEVPEEFDVDTNAVCRRTIWAQMMPTGHCIAVRDVSAELALEVGELLREEGVSPLQAKVSRGRDRRYPAGELEVFGTWGRVAGTEPEPLPRAGLELVADKVFGNGEQPFASPVPAAYSFFVHRNRTLGRTQYYLDRREAEAPPRVVTTLDLDLLRTARRELSKVMAAHKPALAMAIVIDVETGNVLAVDSLEQYEVQPFAPVFYNFTPGSTFKMVTMATAIEEGVVRPDDTFDVRHPPHDPFVLKAAGRTIREAEGSKRGVITATEAFAFSVNAGLVQIGQRIDDERFHAKLKELRYATYPDAELGSESPGYLPKPPWTLNWTHASISFGHELMTTLWQHAGALAAIIRGGEWRPMRLIAAVEQGEERIDFDLEPPRRVFKQETCDIVRGMMSVGATEGTGRHIARPDIVMGTKTGTAEKVASEVCAHVAGAARAAVKETGGTFTEEDYAALRYVPRPHNQSCYTSSMCVVGRPVEGGREVMVFVVVDEPTGKEKFGSRVAGPAAVAILAEALGRTRDGVETTPVTESGFALASPELANHLANDNVEPWRVR